MNWNVLGRLGIALVLGLLVGFQRERGSPQVAGIRTFALTTVLGALAAILVGDFGPWIVPTGLACVAAMLVVGNLTQVKQGELDPGATGEVAALLMYLIGAAVGAGYTAVPVAATGGVALILYWKRPLHELVHRIGEADFRAVMRLVLIAVVILPTMPDRSYGPYQVINPRTIWLMVVLIVGISMAAYVAYKLFGVRAGTILAGVLGGLISSTAATVGYAKRTRERPEESGMAAVLAVIASTVVFGRVLVEIGIVAPEILRDAAPPILAMMLLMAVIGFFLARVHRGEIAFSAQQEPPSDLKGAVLFGLLYAAVLLAVAFARDRFGAGGLYVVAALSGLTDMDAITLSTAQLVKTAELEVDTGWRLILVGAMSNLGFKGAAVAAIGHRRMLGRIAPSFALSILGGVALLVFWP